jgi:hypothetical protein
MSTHLYRLPNTSLYLRDDGLLAGKVEPGQEARTFTEADAPVLEQAYVGKALQLMSGAWKEGIEASVLVADFMDIWLVGFVEWAMKLNKWMQEEQFGTAPDPIMSALVRIDARLRAFEDELFAAWASLRGDNLALLRSHSSTALHTVRAFLNSGKPPTDPLWAQRIAIAERDSLIAVHTLVTNLDDGFWRRPNNIKAISWMGTPHMGDNAWMPHMPDRAAVGPDGTVWDHRWGLPAALYAIAVRVAVLKAFSPASVLQSGQICAEIQQYANFLEAAFHRMLEGVRPLQLTNLHMHDYNHRGWVPVAAVDINGGYYLFHIAGSYEWNPARWPTHLYPQAGMIPFALSEQDVHSNHALITQLWWNHVCAAIGLPDLLRVIGSLRNLCTPSWFSLGFVAAQKQVTGTATDDGARKAASAAKSLAALTSSGDDSADSRRTARLYSALRLGGARAKTAVSRHVDELMRLAAEMEPRKPEIPTDAPHDECGERGVAHRGGPRQAGRVREAGDT